MCVDNDHDGGNDIDRADHVYGLHDDGWHVIDYFDGDEHDLDAAADDDSFDAFGWAIFESWDADEQSASACDYVYDQSDDG